MALQNMHPRLAPTLLIVAACAGGAAEAASAQMASRFTEGQKLRRTVEVETNMKLVELLQSENGGPATSLGDSTQQRTSKERRVFTVIDDITAVIDGEAVAFTRTYKAMKGQSVLKEIYKDEDEGDSVIDFKTPLKSRLENESVLFTLQDEGWLTAPAESSPLRKGEIEHLEPDVTVDCLLPSKKVKRGSTWTAGAAHVGSLLTLADELQFQQVKTPKDEVHSSAMMRVPAVPSGGEWTGAIKLVHQGKKKVRGRQVEVIEVTVDSESKTVATFDAGLAGAMIPPAGGMAGPTEFKTAYTWTYQGKGRLHWDTELEQITHFEIQLDVEEVASETNSFTIPGQGAFTVDMSERSEGSTKISFNAAAL